MMEPQIESQTTTRKKPQVDPDFRIDALKRPVDRLDWLLWLALAIFGLRLFLSGYVGLGDDEAYYWDWSRRLQFSYYDHPAMTAWLIKLGTLIFGQTSLGVRIFGQLCNAVSGYILWKLGDRIFGRTAAVIGLLLYLTAPIFSLGGLLMVPDAPMGMAWMFVCAMVWRIFGENDSSWKNWITAGFALGFGFLSKYTILLLAISVVLLFLTDARTRVEFKRPRFWVTVLIAIVCSLPILIWNNHYDWPTVKYHLHDRQTGGGGASLSRWAQFWASQAIILGPFLFLICLAVWGVAVRRWQDRRWRYLFIMTFPTFALFCAQALFAEFHPHWPAPVYILLFLGVGKLFREGFGVESLRTRAIARGILAAGILLIILPVNLLLDLGGVWPIVPKIARQVAPSLAWDPKFDPTNDLYGWDALASKIKELRAARVATGLSAPFLSSSRYQLTSQLAFATQERVWRVSPDKDQYMFWQTPEEQKEVLGKDSYFITDQRFDRDPRNDFIFKSCEELPQFQYYRGDELARVFHIWLCNEFTGIRKPGA